MIAEPILNRLAARLARALAPPRVPLVPWIVDDYAAGFVDEARATRLAGFATVFDASRDAIRFVPALDTPQRRSEAMAGVARTLAAEGALTAWRNERYAVAPSLDATPLFELERAAARYFGVATHAAHVNGTTAGDTGAPRMWIARRSAAKAIDPGQLDNLVGGGIASGTSVAETLAREAHEEAGIDAAIVARAVSCGVVRILRMQPDGVHRETIHVHDLALPASFVPENQDGEVAGYQLASIDEVASWAGHDEGEFLMTADAALVVVDWLLRHHYVAAASEAGATLDALRRRDDGIGVELDIDAARAPTP